MTRCSVLLLLACFAACTEKPRSYALKDAPAELAPAIERAQGAIGQLKTALSERLRTEIREHGTAEAATICREEAPIITASANKPSVEVGRTSARLRNKANAPRRWLAPMLEQTAHMKPSQVGVRVFDLGDRVGLVKPIAATALCVRCHGTPTAMDAQASTMIATHYPDDQATGYRAGDLRGLFWAEAAK